MLDTTDNSPAPAVSVIVPNYNHARYLPARIGSILAQTFQDFEVILLDDASTDGSASVLSAYDDQPRFRLEINAVNSGSTFKQWNKGVAMARGRYVWLAESDDSAEPTLLQTLVGLLDANPGVGLAHCASLRIDPEGAVLGKMWGPAAMGRPNDFVNAGRDEFLRFLSYNLIPNASAVVFRRELYQRVGGADEGFRLAGDWKLWMTLFLHADVAYVDQTLNHYRVHPGTVRSATRGSGVWFEERLRLTAWMLQQMDVPRHKKREALGDACNQWVDTALSAEGRMTLAMHRRIFARVWALEPGLALRIAARAAQQALLHPRAAGAAVWRTLTGGISS